MEGPLETTAVRLNKNPGVCIAPLYFAEELLRTEGFTDIRFVEIPTVANVEAVASGEVDFAPAYGPLLIPKIEAGLPVSVLAGVMVGCSNCSGTRASAAFPISRTRPLACRIGGQPSTC